MEADVSTPLAANEPNFDLEFIAQFESLTELWNAKHQNYTNKSKRQQGYNKLLTVFKRYRANATVDDVRKKINSLRSNYRRELRRIAEVQKNGDVYTPKSKSFKLLSFLYDSEAMDYTEQKHPTTEVYVKYEEPEETESLQSSMSPVNEHSFNDYNSTPITQVRTSEVCQPAFLSPVSQSPMYQQIKQPPFKENTAWSLAQIWSQKLDKLEPMQRLFAEKAINDVLFEAQLGSLHRNSVKINEFNEPNKETHEGN